MYRFKRLVPGECVVYMFVYYVCILIVHYPLTEGKFKKLKSAAKYKTVITLRARKKNYQYEEMSHELFWQQSKKTKIGNASSKNMSNYIKLTKAQLSKLI